MTATRIRREGAAPLRHERVKLPPHQIAMGTSTNRPKPKSGQSAARNGNGKPDANQEKAGAAEPIAKTTADASDSSAKTTSGALSSTAKTTSGALSSAAKTSATRPTARPTNTKPVNKASPASA